MNLIKATKLRKFCNFLLKVKYKWTTLKDGKYHRRLRRKMKYNY
jgi:hypothetical protein